MNGDSAEPIDGRDLRQRFRAAWSGRISGCQLGKPVELLSMRQGHEALTDYLRRADAIPLRDYVPQKVASYLTPGGACVRAVELGAEEAMAGRGPDALRRHFGDLSPVHTVNNLALVVWGLLAGDDDFGRAIGDTVAAGWDTDCNGATVGGLWGLAGRSVPTQWTDPWNGRVGVSLAGVAELALDDLVERTAVVAEQFWNGRVSN